MPDITMCDNDECTLKKQCYRFMARPTKGWQAYSNFEQGENGKCQYYWEYNVKKRSKNGWHIVPSEIGE